jgi:hypothetical protein
MTDYTTQHATKKEFVADVGAGRNVRMYADIHGMRHIVTLADLQHNVGKLYTVTNLRRTWYAEITIKPNKRITVK